MKKSNKVKHKNKSITKTANDQTKPPGALFTIKMAAISEIAKAIIRRIIRNFFPGGDDPPGGVAPSIDSFFEA